MFSWHQSHRKSNKLGVEGGLDHHKYHLLFNQVPNAIGFSAPQTQLNLEMFIQIEKYSEFTE